MLTAILTGLWIVAIILILGGAAILVVTFILAMIYWLDLITESQIIGPPKLENRNETD